MKEEKDIGNLFKYGLQAHEVPVDSEEWDKLGIKLDRMRFYKFSFSHFNIYYCSMILFCVLSYAYIAGKTFFSAEPEQKVIYSFIKPENGTEPENRTDSLNNINQVEIISQENSVKENPEKDKKPTPTQTVRKDIAPKATTDTMYVKPEKIALPNDTVQTKHKADSVEKKMPEVKRVKKVVHVVKQDTIVILDTLEKKKSRRKK